jgi:antitoxin YefM
MLSLDDYESLNETAYLLKSRANARRLLAATQQLEAGKGRRRKINIAA